MVLFNFTALVCFFFPLDFFPNYFIPLSLFVALARALLSFDRVSVLLFCGKKALLTQSQTHNIDIYLETLWGKQYPWRPLKIFWNSSSADISIAGFSAVLLVETGLSFHSIRKHLPCVHDQCAVKQGSWIVSYPAWRLSI